MRFKKVYIEITNCCNLNCSFCHNNQREKKYITLNEFRHIIEEVKPYTKYVYLHVKGEPLLHPKLEQILDICSKNNMMVNLTTNGTLLKHQKEILLQADNIRQINISLHSENKLSTYFEDIFEISKELSHKIYISYRLWTLTNKKLDKRSTEIVDKIIKNYKLSPEIVEKIYHEDSIKIDFNTFVNKDNLFEWPTLDKKVEKDNFCYGLKTHIGILVDGTVIPCCMDSEGVIELGNIYKESLSVILNKDRTKKIISAFQANKCSEELCQKCSFKNRLHHE